VAKPGIRKAGVGPSITEGGDRSSRFRQGDRRSKHELDLLGARKGGDICRAF